MKRVIGEPAALMRDAWMHGRHIHICAHRSCVCERVCAFLIASLLQAQALFCVLDACMLKIHIMTQHREL